MRFLANENFPGAAVIALSAAGHDVVWMRTAAPGMTDRDVLAWAVRENRILLRLPMPRPGDVGQRISGLIAAREDWAGCFSVIEPGRVRMRPPGS
jgi:hypothetical protein